MSVPGHSAAANHPATTADGDAPQWLVDSARGSAAARRGKLARSSSSRFLAVLSHYLELHFGHPALLTKGRRQEAFNVAGNAVAQSRSQSTLEDMLEEDEEGPARSDSYTRIVLAVGSFLTSSDILAVQQSSGFKMEPRPETASELLANQDLLVRSLRDPAWLGTQDEERLNEDSTLEVWPRA
eukprot:s451_g8.t1